MGKRGRMVKNKTSSSKVLKEDKQEILETVQIQASSSKLKTKNRDDHGHDGDGVIVNEGNAVAVASTPYRSLQHGSENCHLSHNRKSLIFSPVGQEFDFVHFKSECNCKMYFF